MVRDRDGQEHTITSRWVIAADGYKSPVRKALGIAYPGQTYKETLNAQFGQWQEKLEDQLTFYKIPMTLTAISHQNHQLNKVYTIEQPTTVLIRPDGYIAYIGQIKQIGQFTRYLDRWFVAQEVPALTA